VAPCNAGTAFEEKTENVPLDSSDFDGLLNFAHNKQIDLAIVGPENALADGIVDIFTEAGIPCFGPTQMAARLEGSKTFAKECMTRQNIPTARL